MQLNIPFCLYTDNQYKQGIIRTLLLITPVVESSHCCLFQQSSNKSQFCTVHCLLGRPMLYGSHFISPFFWEGYNHPYELLFEVLLPSMLL